MNKIKNVLSLFDGMSCGQIALNKVGVKYENYYAAEIEDHAMKVTQANYPNTIQLGDVTKIDGTKLPKIDLLIGGSPCQSFSTAGKMEGFNGKSGLFWEYVRLLKETKPKYFLLENVVMKKEWEEIINNAMGVKPIKINSKIFTPQSRNRLYWTNIPIAEWPESKNLKLKDILEKDVPKVYDVTQKRMTTFAKFNQGNLVWKENEIVRLQLGKGQQNLVCRWDGISGCLIAGYNHNGKYFTMVEDPHGRIRYMTPTEVEALQGVPKNYTNHISETKRYTVIGNGWNVPTIEHIFKGLL